MTGLAIAGAFIAALAFTALDIVPAASQDELLRAWQVKPSSDHADGWSDSWKGIDPVTVALSAQNTTKPFGGGGVATVKARALQDGERLYVMLEWKDSTRDDTVNGQTAFTDAAAVEYPATPGVSVPALCMGDAIGSVNIWQWKAAWQRDLDLGFATVKDRFPNTTADVFSTERLFQSAQDVGNPISQRTHPSPVENLIAGGFGTLTTADLQDVAGEGRWKDGTWRVVFDRPLTTGQGYPSLAVGDRTNVAFAIWDGSREQRNGTKSTSMFLNLSLSDSAAPAAAAGFPWWAWLLIALVVAAGAGGAAWAYLNPFAARSD